MSKLIRMDHTGHSTLAEWTPEDPAAEAERIGFPLLVKASAGGPGDTACGIGGCSRRKGARRH